MLWNFVLPPVKSYEAQCLFFETAQMPQKASHPFGAASLSALCPYVPPTHANSCYIPPPQHPPPPRLDIDLQVWR